MASTTERDAIVDLIRRTQTGVGQMVDLKIGPTTTSPAPSAIAGKNGVSDGWPCWSFPVVAKGRALGADKLPASLNVIDAHVPRGVNTPTALRAEAED